MRLADIVQEIEGKSCIEHFSADLEIKGCCAADLMSDVLAAARPDAILLTGLCNPQVIRTAQMSDIRAVVLVRGKQPPRETVDLAEREGIPLFSSPFGMFELCGRLYKAGLISSERTLQQACDDE